MSKIKMTDNTKTKKRKCYDSGFYKSNCYLVMATDRLNTSASTTFKGVVVALLFEDAIGYNIGETSDAWNKSEFDPVDVEIILHYPGTL